MRVQLELRNLPRFRIIEYLTEAGGKAVGALSVAGNEWVATLQPLPPAQVGVNAIRRDLLIIEGSDERVEVLHAFMRRKTIRGGG